MPINYGLLTSQQPTARVVASLPVIPQQNGLGQLGQGLMSGIAQGQQIAAQQQQMDESKQRMDQASRLFPSQLENSNNTAITSGVAARTAVQGEQDAKAMRAAAAQGIDAWLNEADKRDPTIRFEFLKKQADFQKVLADIAFTNSETKKNNSAVIDNAALSFGKIVDRAHNAEIMQPGAGNRVYKIFLGQLDQGTQKLLDETGFGTFTPVNNALMHKVGLDAAANIKEAQDAKDATSEMKNAAAIAALQTKVDNKTATPEEEKTLQNLQSMSQKGNADNSGLGKTILTSPEARKEFFKGEELNSALDSGMRTGKQMLVQMNSMPEDALNPITGEFNAKYSAQGQALNKNINQLITQAPSMLGIPATALRSATVWKMVKDAKPRPGMWMVAAKAVTENLLYEGALQQHKTWQSMAEKMQAQAATEVPAAVREAKTWLENHPDPLTEHPKPDLTNFYKLFPKARELGMEDELNAVQGKSTSSQPEQQARQTQFQHGQVYQDASGNKAIYNNGKWEPVQ